MHVKTNTLKSSQHMVKHHPTTWSNIVNKNMINDHQETWSNISTKTWSQIIKKHGQTSSTNMVNYHQKHGRQSSGLGGVFRNFGICFSCGNVLGCAQGCVRVRTCVVVVIV
jgi:hypothetical protein